MNRVSFTLLVCGLLVAQAIAVPLLKENKKALKSEKLAGERQRQELLKFHVSKETLASLQDTGNADQYIDTLLTLTRYQMIQQGYNDITLPDYKFSFDQKILFVTYQGEIGLYNGYLDNLATLYRTSEATITTSGTTIVATTAVGINEAELGYSGVAEFMGIGPRITASGTLESASADVEIEVDILGGTITLTTFEITDIGKISTEVSGLPIGFNWLAEMIADVCDNIVKLFVPFFFDNIIKKIIQNILDQITA